MNRLTSSDSNTSTVNPRPSSCGFSAETIVLLPEAGKPVIQIAKLSDCFISSTKLHTNQTNPKILPRSVSTIFIHTRRVEVRLIQHMLDKSKDGSTHFDRQFGIPYRTR